MKLNDFKDVMDKSFGKRHENISDKKELEKLQKEIIEEEHLSLISTITPICIPLL